MADNIRQGASISLEGLAALTESDVDAIMGIAEAESYLSEIDPDGLAGFADFLTKLKKAVTPPAAFLKKLSAVGKFIREKAGPIVSVAASAISTIYPPAAVIVGPIAKMVNAGIDKLKIVEAARAKAVEVITKAKAAQAALLKVATATAVNAAQDKAAGKEPPAKITIEQSALMKASLGQKVDAAPVTTSAPVPDIGPAPTTAPEIPAATTTAQEPTPTETKDESKRNKILPPTLSSQVRAQTPEDELALMNHERITQ